MTTTTSDFSQQALDYHSYPRPGKLAVYSTKPVNTQEDLALAYSPGVAEPVREIVKDPNLAEKYTNRGNLVGIISNGTAVLGLGNVGPLASKPVMEGKAVLFKKFADIDVFDIEVNANDPQDFIETVARLEPTFGGINLEDIKAPECFYIEAELSRRLSIPVFHDDQHGTAIIVAAGLLNALQLQNKKITDIKVVCLGAGAAGIATMNLLQEFGLHRAQITMVDSKGVVSTTRTDLSVQKQYYAQVTDKKSLSDALNGADVFIGVSGPNLLTPSMLKAMAANPIVFALSNPDPEIEPNLAHATRPDMILATGRSDYPNQVNNVLCFPFMFRGALDVRATTINKQMQVAAVDAIRKLAHLPIPELVRETYPLLAKFPPEVSFCADYILPTPNDPRLLAVVSKAVSQAAIDSGVARLR